MSQTGESVERAHSGAFGPRPAADTVGETLYRELEGLGLSPYEARILLALFMLGSGTPGQLARFSDVPRTSTYQILEELGLKGLAQRVPGSGPAVWSVFTREEVLARLEAVEDERLRQHKVRAERVRQMLDEALAGKEPAALPYVHVIHDPALVKPVYEQLLRDTERELLVFNKPPFSWNIGTSNQVVQETAKRARCRALYQSKEAEKGEGQDGGIEMEGYHAAGFEARVVDGLPIKLAVADRRAALLTLADPVLPTVGFPTVLLVEHPGFASVQADAFELLWQSARPYPTKSAGQDAPAEP